MDHCFLSQTSDIGKSLFTHTNVFVKSPLGPGGSGGKDGRDRTYPTKADGRDIGAYEPVANPHTHTELCYAEAFSAIGVPEAG